MFDAGKVSVMGRLGLLIYTVAAPTLAGSAMVAMLIQPGYTAKMVVIAAIVGAVIALPIAWFVASKIQKLS